MLNPTSHRYVHAERTRDLVRDARVHPLAEVHPRRRRQPLARVRARLGPLRPAAPASS
jgi:hypothetical protein